MDLQSPDFTSGGLQVGQPARGERVGLSCSAGQQQLTAIGRALSHNPRRVLNAHSPHGV